MTDGWILLSGAVAAVNWTWVFRGFQLWRHPLSGHWRRGLFNELRPFYWPAAVAHFGLGFGWRDSPVLVGAVELVVLLLAWLWLRNVGGDDDRWKRRARAAGQRVVRVGFRLRLSPAPAAGGA